MAVTILNLSGNRDGFEDAMCDTLRSCIAARTEVLHARGQALVEAAARIGTNYRVLVLFGHAGPVGVDGTRINTGLGGDSIPQAIDSQLNSPTVLLQVLRGSSATNVILFCACRAISPETIVSAVRDPNCMGIVASSEEVHESDCALIGAIVDGIHDQLARGNSTDQSLSTLVTELTRQHSAYPSFRYFPVPRVTEEPE